MHILIFAEFFLYAQQFAYIYWQLSIVINTCKLAKNPIANSLKREDHFLKLASGIKSLMNNSLLCIGFSAKNNCHFIVRIIFGAFLVKKLVVKLMSSVSECSRAKVMVSQNVSTERLFFMNSMHFILRSWTSYLSATVKRLKTFSSEIVCNSPQ